jgi:ATP-dependent Clp endopeptidase proteolytic subunit ClpP
MPKRYTSGRLPSAGKKYKFKMEDADEEEDEIEDNKVMVLNNNIYFYCEVSKETILVLNYHIEDLSNKLMITSIQNGIDPIPIKLHIQSDGGEVFAAFSAVDTIKKCKVPVETYIEGCAASAATIISVAGHRRFITGNSHMLIHQISSSFWGKMNEFEDEMQNLSLLTKYIMKIYKDNTNLTVKKMKDIFKKDLWMPADECLKMGLVDEIK